MRNLDLTLPELIAVAATRGIGGAGLGLLVADYVAPEKRRAIGWTLLAIGAISTLPIAATLIKRTRPRLLAD
ncbi:MAG TPA: hypothetical protein VH301_07475 [Usitatibacter sp.]|jgi:hypothetical protein|nr:hypothetical protein [Usitatibacter sp.]